MTVLRSTTLTLSVHGMIKNRPKKKDIRIIGTCSSYALTRPLSFLLVHMTKSKDHSSFVFFHNLSREHQFIAATCI